MAALDASLKRALDVAFSVLGLLVSAPLWLLAMAAIKLEDGGPVLYRQERWGRGAGRFFVMKFRTMTPGADKHGVVPATKDDRRVTRVGRILRATGIDELPQALNILRGDMSLVGPRALAVGEKITAPDGTLIAYEELPGFIERCTVRPGLTGYATIYLPKDAAPLEKFEYDARYIARRTVWMDLRLIFLSLWISVRGQWETRTSKL